MKKLLLLTILAAAFFVVPVYAQEPGVITVSGEGTVAVVPDVAHVRLGIETQDESPLVAQTRNNIIMADVLAAIKALGIEESDIQTAFFHMHPMQSWRDDRAIVIGFTVSNSINVTVRDIELAGAVLTAATEAGANMSSNVSFGLLENSAAYNQALALAVADATVKAETIARALGVHLGRAVHVGEMGTISAIPIPRAMAAEAAMMMDAGGFGRGAAVPVQEGEMIIMARVQVTFAIA